MDVLERGCAAAAFFARPKYCNKLERVLAALATHIEAERTRQ